MAAMGIIGAGMSMIGSMTQASGTIAAGKAQQQNAYFQAAQLDQQADQSRAVAQRSALQDRKKAGLADSTLIARAAADGGSATDATAVTDATAIAGQGEYNALGDMFKGEDRARGQEDQAAGLRAGGDAALAGARSQASGTLFGSFGGLASKFGGLGSSSSSFG